jgi:hypothetical protein
MSTGNRLRVAAAATAAVCASSGVALAGAGSYKISKIKVPSSVKERSLDAQQGKGFTITVTGSAKNKAALDVYLDHKKCRASEKKEYTQDGGYRAGYPFFIGPSSVTGTQVKGSFKKSFNAHPGSKTGRRYVCVYLATGKAGTRTRAFKSATFQVTK